MLELQGVQLSGPCRSGPCLSGPHFIVFYCVSLCFCFCLSIGLSIYLSIYLSVDPLPRRPNHGLKDLNFSVANSLRSLFFNPVLIQDPALRLLAVVLNLLEAFEAVCESLGALLCSPWGAPGFVWVSLGAS